MRRQRVAAILAIFGVGLCCASARAVVQTIDATVRSTVQQFQPDGVVNSDTAFESLDESTSNLPLTADARLSSSPDPAYPSSATAITIFSDPRASETEDPNEFGLDLVAFSLDPVTDYEAVGTAVETRQITFTADELGHEEGTELVVTSHFFVDGYMVIWGDLDPLVGPTTAQLRVRVHQTRPDQERRVVMEANLSLAQNADGTAALTADGAITADNVVLIDTLGTILPLGNAYFVTLPQMSIPYTYEALVGETFTLDADVECRITNQPYTGAAVTLGVPFERLLSSIGGSIGQPISSSQVLARTNGVMPVPIKPLQAATGTQVRVVGTPTFLGSRIVPCGGLGIESMMLPVFSLLLLFFCRRR